MVVVGSSGEFAGRGKPGRGVTPAGRRDYGLLVPDDVVGEVRRPR
jgi:hypothetical protein